MLKDLSKRWFTSAKAKGFMCNYCMKRFDPVTKPAALLFGPPTNGTVRKHHVCCECYEEIKPKGVV